MVVDNPVFNRRAMQLHRLTAWEACYAVNMAIACAISYAVITQLLAGFINEANTQLGGMWAVVATVFVFRETRASTLSAGTARFIATCVSFVLCLVYLLIFPVTGPGIAVVIGLGTVAMMMMGRQDDIVTAGITTAVVLVVAERAPEHAWQQPLLRLFDTVVGIGVGVLCKWCTSYAFFRVQGVPAR